MSETGEKPRQTTRSPNDLAYVVMPSVVFVVMILATLNRGAIFIQFPIVIYALFGGACFMLMASFVPIYNKFVANRLAFTSLALSGIGFLFVCAIIYDVFGLIYSGGPIEQCPLDAPSCEEDHSFLTALYFSVVTFTTLGYGDFHPASSLRLMASMQALMGYMFLGFAISAISEGVRNKGDVSEDCWDFSALAGVLKAWWISSIWRKFRSDNTSGDDKGEQEDSAGRAKAEHAANEEER